MGSFRVALEIGDPQGHRYEHVQALVDTGATYTWVPKDLLERLGVVAQETLPFVLADGREVSYDVAAVRVRIDDRSRTTMAVFGDEGSDPLLGVVTLEEFLLAVDPVRRRLVKIPGLLKPSIPTPT